MNVVKAFATHLNSFLLNGISAITMCEVEYDICRTEGSLIYCVLEVRSTYHQLFLSILCI